MPGHADDGAWTALPIAPYGVLLHVPAGWEALPPVPANGPEILRATGGPDQHLIVFKVPANGRTAEQVAAIAQQRLAAHGYDDFTLTSCEFAGRAGAALEFVMRAEDGSVKRRMREYFAVRGPAAFILGTGSSAWEDQLPLIEQIAQRFELTGFIRG